MHAFRSGLFGFTAILLVLQVPLLAADSEGGKVDDRIKVAAGDWPWWRGPLRNGVASADQNPPTKWSATENVAWKSPIPGRGHGSPTVAGDRIYLATADEKADVQYVLCYDRKSGKQIWQTAVHQGGEMRQNAKSSAASSTVACDGDRVYINFANSGAVVATALSLDGVQIWQTKVCDYTIHQGYAASPALYQSLVLIAADNKGGGAVAGLNRKSGKIVWKRDRPKLPNYTSPVLVNIGGRDQLLMTGCDLVASFNPLTGDTLWEAPGSTTECVTSTVTDGKYIITSGGYPRNHVAAMLAGGSGEIAWDSTTRVYVPSFVERGGYLYGVLDAGVATCWKLDTGKEVWKSRVGGTFSSSPVLVGERIYATNEEGETFVWRASPDKFEQLGESKLGSDVFATPAICGGRIYMRVAERNGDVRQEMLYCLAEPN